MNDEKVRERIGRLENVDRRAIFVLIGLAIVLPLFTSWRLALTPAWAGSHTREL